MAVDVSSGHRVLEVDWDTGKMTEKKNRPVCTSPASRGRFHLLPPRYSGKRDFSWVWTYQAQTLALRMASRKPPKWELLHFRGDKAEGEPDWKLDLGGPSPVMSDGDDDTGSEDSDDMETD